MAPPYQRGFSFTGFQANQPRASLPGQRVDIELDEIAGVLTGFGEAIATLRPLPGRSLNVNLLNSVAYPQPVSIDSFKTVLGLNLLQPALGFVPENVARRGQAGGYAPLGADGKVPAINLPDLGGGNGGPVTSASITDASASGKTVLVGTPAQARSALLLGSAATRDVGVAGGVASFDDSRFATAGSVASDKITDASATGRAVVTGTPSAGRVALQALGLGKTVGPDIDWQNFTTHQTSTLLNVGNLPDVCFPGGNTVGCYSAIMGAVDIKTPGQNNASTFAAAVGGIVRSTMSNPSLACLLKSGPP